MLLRTILGKTLRDERSGVIGYGLGLALYGLLIVMMFPSISQAPGLAEMMDNYPPAMKALGGEITAITTIEGFIALETLTWLPLILATPNPAFLSADRTSRPVIRGSRVTPR